MNQIDISNWRGFKVKELFDIRPTKNYGLINNNLFSNPGTTPVIVNSSFNNGIGGYVSLEPTEKGGIITFSDTTSATAIFYQPNDFIGYSHIQGMYPKSEKWTENSMLFFLTVFKKAVYLLGIDYVNKFTRDIAREIVVKLPVDKNNDIDWDYMDKFIKKQIDYNIEYVKKISKITNFKKKKMNVKNWGKFTVKDLFQVVAISKKYGRKDLTNDGKVPVYSSKHVNNGIEGYCNNKPDFIVDSKRPFYLIFGDHTKSMNISTKSFCVMDNVKVLVPKYNDIKIIHFICTVWKKQIPNLGYSRHWNVAKKILIKLPVDNNGNLDINYIHKFYNEQLNSLQLK